MYLYFLIYILVTDLLSIDIYIDIIMKHVYGTCTKKYNFDGR